jgi:hypothetical protein
MALPKRYDFKNNRKDRDLGIAAYIVAGGRYSDDPKNPHHRGMAWRLGLSLDQLARYREEDESFDAECEAALSTEDYNLRQRAIKGCFNKDGEVIAEKLLARFLESRGVIEKESKGPMTALQLNAGSGGIQVAFVEPNAQLVEATDGQEA